MTYPFGAYKNFFACLKIFLDWLGCGSYSASLNEGTDMTTEAELFATGDLFRTTLEMERQQEAVQHGREPNAWLLHLRAFNKSTREKLRQTCFHPHRARREHHHGASIGGSGSGVITCGICGQSV